MHGLALMVLLASGAQHRTKVAVLDLSAPAQLQMTASELTPVVVSELAKHAELSVISSREVAATLGLEKQRQLLGCAEDRCLAEIGGALGADYLVTGSLARLGTRYRLDVRLLRASNGSIVASAGDFVAPSEDALADATVRLADALAAQLLGQPASQPRASAQTTSKPSAPEAAQVPPAQTTSTPEASVSREPAGGLSATAPAPRHTAAYVCWGIGAATLVGAVAMTLITRNTFNEVHDQHQTQEADSLKWKGPLADGLWLATIAAGGVGTYLYFSTPASGSGGDVAVGGRF